MYTDKEIRMFESFKERGYQSQYITFLQFKSLLKMCKENGIDEFWYIETVQEICLECDEYSKLHFGAVKFSYEDGINCLNENRPEVFKCIKMNFSQVWDKKVEIKKKDTKQVTF